MKKMLSFSFLLLSPHPSFHNSEKRALDNNAKDIFPFWFLFKYFKGNIGDADYIEMLICLACPVISSHKKNIIMDMSQFFHNCLDSL